MNFRHPSLEGNFFDSLLTVNFGFTVTSKMVDRFEWWLSGVEATGPARICTSSSSKTAHFTIPVPWRGGENSKNFWWGGL
ncbi:hypothetical protein [Chryseobacterium taichungense]|uniref:hypothetical protein n=1 Tax=Chryseobacterium taichungense TaxID=295069 RepID=UPI00115FFFD8|nr:hypothetical protein [Chryseobacterium taichungense]